MATTRTTRKTATTDSEEAPMTTTEEAPAATEAPSDPFSIFETVRFPGRGRASSSADYDDKILSAVNRRKKYMDQGVPADKIFTVLDLSDLSEKEVDSFRSKIGNACGRVAPDFKIEWRTLPETPALRAQFAQFEKAISGDELETPTHAFRVAPKNGHDPHAPVAEAPTDTETASE